MTDPFATALDALYSSPMAVAAIYTPAGGDPRPLRVIRSQPTEETPFGRGTVRQGTNIIEMRRVDVPLPEVGDRVDILDDQGVITETLELLDEPDLDVEGLTWTCGASPFG